MPLAHDPLALLHAALATSRPELLVAFQRQMEAHIDAGEPLDPSSMKGLVQALVNVSTEVYDLRRTVDAMLEAQKYINQSLRGCQKHLDVAREVGNLGRAGRLPADYGPTEMLAAVRIAMEDQHDD